MEGIRGKVLSVILVSAILLSGCGNDLAESIRQTEEGLETEEITAEQEAAETEPEAEEEPEEKTAEETEDMGNELYNTYVDINNIMVDRFADVIASYFEDVDYQEEFVPLIEDYGCLSNVSTFYAAMDKANELLEKTPEMDALDEAYLELYPVMRELAETLDEVEEYTDMMSYVDDDYAKGKEYHAIIWKDCNEYETLGNRFIEELTVVATVRRNEDLERLKEEGYEITYSFVKLIQTAQEIQAAIYEQDLDDSRLLELDIEQLQPLYDQYVEEVRICLDYMEDEEAMYEEGYPIKSAYYGIFGDCVKESKTALTELFERVKNQEALDEFELNSGFAADGSIRKFDETVSEIIDNFNSMLNY